MEERLFYTCVEWPRPHHRHDTLEEFLNKCSRDGMRLAFVVKEFDGITLIFTSPVRYPD